MLGRMCAYGATCVLGVCLLFPTIASAEEAPGLFDRVVENVHVLWAKATYVVFPKLLGEDLEAIDMRKVSSDDVRLRFWMRVAGHEMVLGQLVRDSQGGNCHLEAHFVGRMTFSLFGINPFQSFDKSCQFGYSHGLIEGYIAAAYSDDVLDRLALECDPSPTRIDQIVCTHGVGHGIMLYTGHQIPEALEGCAIFGTKVFIERCYTGVFMEDTINTWYVSYSPDTTRTREMQDSLYPCNALESSSPALPKCYFMQPHKMLFIRDFDFEKVVQECRKIPNPDYRLECMGGVGYFLVVTSDTLPDAGTLAAKCNEFGETADDIAHCGKGVAQVYLLFWGAEYEPAVLDFCRKLESGQVSCIEVVDYLLERTSSSGGTVPI